MHLGSLDYEEFNGTAKEWSITGLTLDRVNLIVGKNASGKTRVLNVLAGLGKILAGKLERPFASGTWHAIFKDASPGTLLGERTSYEIEFRDQVIHSERLLTDRKRLLSRDATGNGYLYAATLRKNLRFRASFDQVTAVSKRDALQHPYLEALHSWGMSVQHYQFGTDLGRTLLAIFRKGPPPPGHTSPDPATPLTVFKKALDKSPEQYKRLLRADLDAVGYPNSDVGLASLESVVIEGPPPTALFVKETDLPVPTLQTEMSQGMFRVVAILAQVNAAIVTNTPQVVLIDDIGEGLDFERSTNLIRLLVRKAEEHSFQLTMTTNDRFVMNAVPLDYWSILSRSGGIVRVFNQRNARKRFLEFKRLGLNNFDFFTNNYFLAAQKDEKARRVR